MSSIAGDHHNIPFPTCEDADDIDIDIRADQPRSAAAESQAAPDEPRHAWQRVARELGQDLADRLTVSDTLQHRCPSCFATGVTGRAILEYVHKLLPYHRTNITQRM